MLIVIPFYGDTVKFRPVLDRWFEVAKQLPGFDAQKVILLTDDETAAADAAKAHNCGVAAPVMDGFRDLVRPDVAYDLKGALVCAFLLKWSYPVLVLDADALLMRWPDKALMDSLKECAVAMPIDDGALIHYRATHLEAPFAHVKKLCAGVMWFGAPQGGRSRLVAAYRRAWEKLASLAPAVPWSPQLVHLTEQYAWAIALHQRGGKILPRTMNWAPQYLGENPEATVCHHYGHKKWRK